MCTFLCTVAGVFCFLLLYGETYAQSAAGYVLSSRLGSEIDGAERDYFGLFPSIQGFLTAHGRENADGGVLFTIRRKNDMGISDTAMYIGGDTLAVLRAYVEEYERLFNPDYTLARIHQILAYIHADFVPGSAQVVTVETRRGKLITGQVVFVTDTTLVLWDRQSPYDWQRLAEPGLLSVLHTSQIERLDNSAVSWLAIVSSVIAGIGAGAGSGKIVAGRIPDQILIGSGVTTLASGLMASDVGNIRIGGNPGAYLLQLVRLRGHEMFPEQKPPELLRAVRERELEPGFREITPPVSMHELDDDILSARKFHIYTGRYWRMMGLKNQATVIDLSVHGAYGIPGTAMLGEGSWDFGLEYSIVPRVRIGGRYALAYEPQPGREQIHEYVWENVMGLASSFVLIQANPLRRNPFELTVGTGLLSYEASYISVRKRSKALDTLYDGTASLTGLMVNTRIGYYARTYYSIWLGFEGRFFPSFSLPDRDRIRQLNEFITQHTINPSNMGLTMGAQFSF